MPSPVPDKPSRSDRWLGWFRFWPIALGVFGLDALVRAIAEGLWFSELGFLDLGLGRAIGRWGSFAIVLGLSFWVLASNGRLARRLASRKPSGPIANPDPRSLLGQRWWQPPLVADASVRQPSIVGGTLRALPLFASVLGIAILLGFLVLDLVALAWDLSHRWEGMPLVLPSLRPIAVVERLLSWVKAAPAAPAVQAAQASQAAIGFGASGSISGATTPSATGFNLTSFAWLAAGPLLVGLAILWRSATVLRLINFGISGLLAWIISSHWPTVALAIAHWRNSIVFGETDPTFGRDLSWYIFTLPIGGLVEFWGLGLGLVAIASALLVYWTADRSLSQGRFPGFTANQLRHLASLLASLFLLTGLAYGWAGFEVVYSRRGVVYGAGFTDWIVQQPANAFCGGLAIVAGVWLLVYGLTGRRLDAWFWGDGFWGNGLLGGWLGPRADRPPDLRPADLARAVVSYGAIALIVSVALPAVVQGAIVEPNELEREQPYLQRNLVLTRRAFGLDRIESRQFDPQGQLTPEILGRHEPTIRNIRLWDTRPLLASNRQLQQLRPYYRFANADLDRYRFGPRSAQSANQDDRSLQQVILSARELDYSAVPTQAKTWLNEHLVYSHGYGFTLSPVNRAVAGGLPDYFVRDIRSGEPVRDRGAKLTEPGTGTGATRSDRQDGRSAGAGNLDSSDRTVSESLPLDRPRIYYGELTNSYVLAPTAAREFDYPSGAAETSNAYNHYDGQGGIAIGQASWRRWLLAWSLRDWQLLLTHNLQANSRLLWRRNIIDRVQAIAPFLQFDRDPYLVVADLADEPGFDANSHLYWLIDAYTVSSRYPYAEPHPKGFNYIRNSVKVVIDAYNGSVRFYLADASDPIAQAWQTWFPHWLEPIDRLPPALRSHLRYPTDLFQIQSELLLTYHINDPQVFYNREDLWQVPNEIYGSVAKAVEPYFAILQLGDRSGPEFTQLLPFSPAGRGNLIGWLAARSDGADYGKLLLYRFPKDRQIFGTEQMEARINQDPEISRQFSLWNRQGARAIQGNLLIVPIERSLLYVEPIYLEATERGLPSLARVVVAYGNRIVMRSTLAEAIAALFPTATPAKGAAQGATPKARQDATQEARQGTAQKTTEPNSTPEPPPESQSQPISTEN